MIDDGFDVEDEGEKASSRAPGIWVGKGVLSSGIYHSVIPGVLCQDPVPFSRAPFLLNNSSIQLILPHLSRVTS